MSDLLRIDRKQAVAKFGHGRPEVGIAIKITLAGSQRKWWTRPVYVHPGIARSRGLMRFPPPAKDSGYR